MTADADFPPVTGDDLDHLKEIVADIKSKLVPCFDDKKAGEIAQIMGNEILAIRKIGEKDVPVVVEKVPEKFRQDSQPVVDHVKTLLMEKGISEEDAGQTAISILRSAEWYVTGDSETSGNVMDLTIDGLCHPANKGKSR